MNIQPGIYPTLSNKAYHSHKASYSKSSLADYSEYPYKLIYNRAHRERKRQFDMGTAAHSAILEPDTFEDTLALIPPEVLGKNGARSTKAYKKWLANQPDDKAIVSIEQRDQVLRIRDSVLNNPAHSLARDYLTGGRAEISCFWHEQFKGDEIEEETGYHRMEPWQYGAEGPETHKLLMKVRPDYIPAERIVVDLKTTQTAIDGESFERQSYNLHYHWSAALTLRGLSQASGKNHTVYIFVVVEIDPPHEVSIFQANRDFIDIGKLEIMNVMQRLAWSDKNNKWPGMPNKLLQLGLPGWAFKKTKEIL